MSFIWKLCLLQFVFKRKKKNLGSLLYSNIIANSELFTKQSNFDIIFRFLGKLYFGIPNEKSFYPNIELKRWFRETSWSSKMCLPPLLPPRKFKISFSVVKKGNFFLELYNVSPFFSEPQKSLLQKSVLIQHC